MYWFPHTDRMLIKRNDRLDADLAEAEPLSRLAVLAGRRLPLQHALRRADRRPPTGCPSVIPRMNQAQRPGAVERATYSDVAHRVFTAPRRVVFREMEYAVPREAGLAALREARRR